MKWKCLSQYLHNLDTFSIYFSIYILYTQFRKLNIFISIRYNINKNIDTYIASVCLFVCVCEREREECRTKPLLILKTLCGQNIQNHILDVIRQKMYLPMQLSYSSNHLYACLLLSLAIWRKLDQYELVYDISKSIYNYKINREDIKLKLNTLTSETHF